jgi:hypothetical protein
MRLAAADGWWLSWQTICACFPPMFACAWLMRPMLPLPRPLMTCSQVLHLLSNHSQEAPALPLTHASNCFQPLTCPLFCSQGRHLLPHHSQEAPAAAGGGAALPPAVRVPGRFGSVEALFSLLSLLRWRSAAACPACTWSIWVSTVCYFECCLSA